MLLALPAAGALRAALTAREPGPARAALTAGEPGPARAALTAREPGASGPRRLEAALAREADPSRAKHSRCARALLLRAAE